MTLKSLKTKKNLKHKIEIKCLDQTDRRRFSGSGVGGGGIESSASPCPPPTPFLRLIQITPFLFYFKLIFSFSYYFFIFSKSIKMCCYDHHKPLRFFFLFLNKVTKKVTKIRSLFSEKQTPRSLGGGEWNIHGGKRIYHYTA